MLLTWIIEERCWWWLSLIIKLKFFSLIVKLKFCYDPFCSPILLEVPHFASLRGKEREVVVLRSDNGESWYEHPVQATEDAVVEALGTSAEGGIHGSQPSVSSLWREHPLPFGFLMYSACSFWIRWSSTAKAVMLYGSSAASLVM